MDRTSARQYLTAVGATILISSGAIGIGFGLGPALADGNGPDGGKVGVCHRTGSESNPYVYINVPADEANGHITGTDKQHNEKVTWNEAGTWRGVPHNAGDLRLDYYAPGGKADCDQLTVTTPPPTTSSAPPTTSSAPPTTSSAPPTTSSAPPTTSSAPPTTS
ncbi:MAG: hypothetical protein H0X12_18310, partial [Nocardioides sp.]|nr:hypothetical protein [Nocardioides sp.]